MGQITILDGANVPTAWLKIVRPETQLLNQLI